MERLCGEFENLREAKAASRRLEGRQGGRVGLGLDPGYDGARQWVFLEGGGEAFYRIIFHENSQNFGPGEGGKLLRLVHSSPRAGGWTSNLM